MKTKLIMKSRKTKLIVKAGGKLAEYEEEDAIRTGDLLAIVTTVGWIIVTMEVLLYVPVEVVHLVGM